MEFIKEVTILSLGAGTQSSAMLVLAEQGKIPKPDYAIFADTQAEPQEVYLWLDKLKKYSTIPIIECTKGSLEKDTLNQTERSASIPFFIKNEDGSQGLGRRQCTAEYKILPIFKKIRELYKYPPRKWMRHKVNMQMGISTDEIYRVKTSKVKWITNSYPLIDLNLSRIDCIKIVEQSGLGTPPRSACYFCPYHNDTEWLRIKNNPDLWKKAITFDEAIRKQKKFNGENYLHRSMVPLKEVTFKNDSENFFNNECEGMCGV